MTDYKIKDTAFYSGEDVLAEDLERSSSGAGEEICTRFRDMVNSIRMGATVSLDHVNYAGIWHDNRDTSNFPYTNFSGSDFYDFHLAANGTFTKLLDVGRVLTSAGPSGVAYDTLGRRIEITTDKAWIAIGPDNNPPESTGNILIDLGEAGGDYTAGTVNYIYIRWIEIRDPAVISVHPIDGSNQYISRENGYKILAVAGSPGFPDNYLPAHLDDVYIGNVTAQGSGALTGVTDDDALRYYLAVDARHVKARTPITIGDRPAVYAPDKIITLEDHIRAVDSITEISNINPHGFIGDSLVKADLHDPAAGYLDAKVDGVSVFVNPVTHQMYSVATGSSDHKVIGDINDRSPDYLDGKVDNSTIYVPTIAGPDQHKLVVKPGGITTTEIANKTIIHANMATYDAVGGPIIRKGHLDNANDTTSIANLVNGGNADTLHSHAIEKAFIENSTYTFADYTTGFGGGEELAFSVTVPTKIGQQVTVIWYCLNGSGNPNPSARESAIRLKITEGALALDHTILTGATATAANPLPTIEMETIRATTNGGTLIQCYTQYTGTVPGSGWSVVNANRLSAIAALNV